MPDVETTEFTDLDVDSLHLVKRGANGFPPLLAKSALEEVEAAKAEMAEGDEVPGAQSAEADEIEDEMTKAVLCGVDDCTVCADRIAKGKLKAKQRRALPKSSFAIPEKAPESGSYPIPDHGHAVDALARASGKPEESRVRAAVRRKFPGIEQDGAEKSPGVPDGATAVSTTMEGGHVTATGESGQRVAPMTAGTKPVGDPSTHGAGESTYVIPAEAKVEHPQGGPLAAKVAYAVASLAEAQERIEQNRARVANKGHNFLAVDNPAGAAAADVGSGPWETYDSATLREVAQNLAACGHAIDAIQKREAIEAVSGDAGDATDSYDLGAAGDALDYALGIVARLAFHEGAEVAKTEEVAKLGRRLSSRTESALRAARDHLASVLGEDSSTQAAGHGGAQSEEDRIMTELTKEELAEMVAKAAGEAAREAVKAERKAAKKAAKEARKNANNGGDIDRATIEAGGGSRHDADDIAAAGGKVKPEYATKEIEDDVKGLRKQVEELEAKLQKQLARPRPGGPSLTGTLPAGFGAAEEGRQGEGAAKSAEDQEIERLQKQLEEAQSGKDMQRAADISYRLSKAQLAKMHREGDQRVMVTR